MKCDMCNEREADYFLKKTPPGMDTPKQQLYLCSQCAGQYLKHDTVSIVRISKRGNEGAR